MNTRQSLIVDFIAGARPNFMKIAPIIRAMEARRVAGGPLRYRLIHTGQHYDRALSGSFFEQLGIPDPDINLHVGSGTQAEQTASIMVRYEKVLLESSPALCLVVGDVTSTMACAIAAQKLRVPVAHVEAGIRSGDWSMPEEINRLLTDAITDWFFTTSEVANDNLRRSGVAEERIFFVGNTMIDTLLSNMDRLRPPSFWGSMALAPRGYLVLTLHRPSNVDDPVRLASLLRTIDVASRGMPIIFPVHPRTAKSISALDSLPASLHLVGPQSYLEFNWMVKHSLAVITDSGGVTEETTVMKIPCMTLRDTTERPETVTMGTNVLLGNDPSAIAPAFARLFDNNWPQGSVPPLWDGRAGARIVEALERLVDRRQVAG